MSPRILITGGSGFIGSNLIDYYCAKGFQCLNIDLLPPPKEDTIGIWKKVDLLNIDDLRREVLAFKPTYVLHMAARTDLSEKKDLNGYAVNFKGTENLIDVLKECDSIKRAIFASSMLVCKSGYSPKNYDEYCPPNLYGESKALMEDFIKRADIKTYEWIIVRPTSIWGPGFKAPYNDFFTLIKNGNYVKFTGKSATKVFGYIYNIIYQINQLLFLDGKVVNNRIFYLGDNPPVNINTWADIIATHFGVKIVCLPFAIIKMASWIGDFLQLFNFSFPIYSFRMKNMITDNIIELLNDTIQIIPHQPYTLEEGVQATVNWMNTGRK